MATKKCVLFTHFVISDKVNECVIIGKNIMPKAFLKVKAKVNFRKGQL